MQVRTFEACDRDEAMVLLARKHALSVLLFADVQMPSERRQPNSATLARRSSVRRRRAAAAGVTMSGPAFARPVRPGDLTPPVRSSFTMKRLAQHLSD